MGLIVGSYCGVSLIVGSYCGVGLIVGSYCGMGLIDGSYCGVGLIIGSYYGVGLIVDSYCGVSLIVDILLLLLQSEGEDVYVLCGCVKRFLRDLSEPLIPQDIQDELIDASGKHSTRNSTSMLRHTAA